MTQRQQRGLSLVELLIAITLSVIIIGGIVQAFIANRQSYAVTEALVRIQENGRFALNFLTSTLRTVGDYGCLPEPMLDNSNIQIHLASSWLADANPIQLDAPGADANFNTQDGAASADATSFDSPDVLTILAPVGEVALFAGTVAGSSVQFEITNEGDFDQNDYVLVSNCQVADYIRLKADATAATATTGPILEDETAGIRLDFYSPENITTTVQEVQVMSFFINDEALQVSLNSNAGGMAAAQELVTGIENMQLEYGVDTGNDLIPDYFDTITNVNAQGDTDDIVAIKIQLMAVSGSSDEGFDESLTTALQTFAYNRKAAVQATDNRLRRVFETTISLRNQLN